MGGLKVQWREKEGGWMGVMQVNRKGWTAWCMDITQMGLLGAAEVARGSTPLHSLTKDADFLAHYIPFL